MAKEKFPEESAAILAPIIEKLLTMMGAARDAFNRHSTGRLQELHHLQRVVSQDIVSASRQLRSLISWKSEAEQKVLLRLETILSCLGAIDTSLAGLADPIHKKIRGACCFPTRQWPRPTISLTSMPG